MTTSALFQILDRVTRADAERCLVAFVDGYHVTYYLDRGTPVIDTVLDADTREPVELTQAELVALLTDIGAELASQRRDRDESYRADAAEVLL